MKKGKLYTAVNALIYAGILIISNPSPMAHQVAFEGYGAFDLGCDDYDFRMMVPVERANFGVFSLTRITYSHTEVENEIIPNKRTIGIGVLGNVWIYKDPRKD